MREQAVRPLNLVEARNLALARVCSNALYEITKHPEDHGLFLEFREGIITSDITGSHDIADPVGLKMKVFFLKAIKDTHVSSGCQLPH